VDLLPVSLPFILAATELLFLEFKQPFIYKQFPHDCVNALVSRGSYFSAQITFHTEPLDILFNVSYISVFPTSKFLEIALTLKL
jgi:hypothetical protein